MIRLRTKYILLFLFILGIIILSGVSGKNSVLTNAELKNNKKIGWGIKNAENHEQPDVGNQNKKILESYEGITLGNQHSKNIYLTFDEGYEAGNTSELLRILKDNDVTATFFLTAHYINTNADLVKQMIEENHVVRQSHYKT